MSAPVMTIEIPAGFGRRLAAFVIDLIVINIGSRLTRSLLIPGWLFLAPLAYFWLMTGLTGRTFGKMALGIEVRAEGGRVGLGRAFLREVIGKTVSFTALFLGFLWIAIDAKHRGWHDVIAGTRVVVVDRSGATSSGVSEVAALLAARGEARAEWLTRLPQGSRLVALRLFAHRYPGDVIVDEDAQTLRPTGTVEWF